MILGDPRKKFSSINQSKNSFLDWLKHNERKSIFSKYVKIDQPNSDLKKEFLGVVDGIVNEGQHWINCSSFISW